VSELVDMGSQPALARGQDAPVGVGEAREVEGQELLEGAFGLVEAGLQLLGGGTQRRSGRGGRARHGAPRIAEQCLAGRRVGRRLPGGEERRGLTGAQPVTDDGLGQPRLVAPRQRREGRGRGGRDAAGVDVPRDRRREPPAQEEAAIDQPRPRPRSRPIWDGVR
jgi:hypothetical protein